VRGIVDAVRRPLRVGAVVTLALLCVPVAGSADTIGGATASNEIVVKRGDRGPAVRSIQRALGIPADGAFGPQTDRAVRRFQRRTGLVADGVVGPLTRSALGLDPFTRSSVRRGSSGLPSVLIRIAECESGGNPRAVSGDGRYRGKYQFTLGTWRSLGGEGDPAAAPEWLQDRLALRLYRRSGTAPWPSCA
jgi:Transglycosylase-like domain/Putative peptidoglycan binding domain